MIKSANIIIENHTIDEILPKYVWVLVFEADMDYTVLGVFTSFDRIQAAYPALSWKTPYDDDIDPTFMYGGEDFDYWYYAPYIVQRVVLNKPEK